MKAFLIAVFCGVFALSGTAQTTDTVRIIRMTDTEFNRFLKGMPGQDLRTLTPETLESLRDRFTAPRTHFSTAQTRKLLNLIEKDSGKLALARELYHQVSDRENFVQLSDVFRDETYRREFILWCNQPDKS